MAFQAPWSPTAHAFAQHQFAHVTNFWKQGRPARFRLEALPGGKAELNLTFQLPPASEVIPPPYHVSPVPRQRPILPLFPHGYLPQGYAPQKEKPKQAPKLSSRRRKSYRRSVLHKAALAVPTLPPPVVGSLRQAAQACVQRLQAASALPSTPSGYKRPFSDSSSPSPSNHPPLPQRIRKDFQIEESEVESPEKEILRSAPILGNSPTPVSPLVKDFPSPAPLVLTPVPPVPLFFTPPKSQERSEMPANIAEEISAEKVVALEGSESDLEKFDESDSEDAHTLSCVNCDAEMTPDHQCDSDEQRFTKYLMRWSQRLEERTDDSALKSRLLESLVDAYHTPELHSWHTPVSALDLKAVKKPVLGG